MRIAEVRQLLTTPVYAPAFFPGPHRFFDREYLSIVYRSDPEALRRVVPEPLEIAEPLVRFEVMRMPDSTAVGDYTESGQVVTVTYDGERGEFSLGMYLDNLPAIAGGREAGALPKKPGKPRLFVDSDTVLGRPDYGSLRAATATMGYKHRELDAAQACAEITAPTYQLKILPRYDGKPRICELVRSQITAITVKGAWRGPARLQLFAHALAALADLPVREVIGGSHILTDLTLGPDEVVYDYLTERAQRQANSDRQEPEMSRSRD